MLNSETIVSDSYIPFGACITFCILKSEFRTTPKSATRSDGLPAEAPSIAGSEGWRARQDSNLRPLAPEANALSS